MSNGTGWPEVRAMDCKSRISLTAWGAAGNQSEPREREDGIREEHSTFEVFRSQQYRAYMVRGDKGFDLVIHRSAIKAHHKELAQLSIHDGGLVRARDGDLAPYLASSQVAGTLPLTVIQPNILVILAC